MADGPDEPPPPAAAAAGAGERALDAALGVAAEAAKAATRETLTAAARALNAASRAAVAVYRLAPALPRPGGGRAAPADGPPRDALVDGAMVAAVGDGGDSDGDGGDGFVGADGARGADGAVGDGGARGGAAAAAVDAANGADAADHDGSADARDGGADARSEDATPQKRRARLRGARRIGWLDARESSFNDLLARREGGERARAGGATAAGGATGPPPPPPPPPPGATSTNGSGQADRAPGGASDGGSQLEGAPLRSRSRAADARRRAAAHAHAGAHAGVYARAPGASRAQRGLLADAANASEAAIERTARAARAWLLPLVSVRAARACARRAIERRAAALGGEPAASSPADDASGSGGGRATAAAPPPPPQQQQRQQRPQQQSGGRRRRRQLVHGLLPSSYEAAHFERLSRHLRGDGGTPGRAGRGAAAGGDDAASELHPLAALPDLDGARARLRALAAWAYLCACACARFLSPLAWLRWLRSVVVSKPLALLTSFLEGLTELLARHEEGEADLIGGIIRGAGYPYEQVEVTTADGYILTMDRLPNRGSRRVVYMQAGLLDSSVGWLTENCVSSPALAAWDRGYDVWLGNFRGWAGARRHADPAVRDTQWRYWNFSLDDHALHDIPAFMERIHATKCAELREAGALREEELRPGAPRPYTVSVIAHSVGAAATLVYAVHERTHERAVPVDHMVLCAPAGFHMDIPLSIWLISLVFGNYLTAPLVVRHISAVYIPSRVLRLLFRKVVHDLAHELDAVGELLGVVIGNVVFGGDASDWSLAASKRDYLVARMPGISIQLLLQLQQSLRTGRFEMRDYGRAENLARYGSARPFDVGANYAALRGLPVDILAGTRDALTPAAMVRRHYELLLRAGVAASYQELDYGHLEFAIHVRDQFVGSLMAMMDAHAWQERTPD